MPFSIIGSVDDVTTPDGRVVKGREYLWGVAEGERVVLDLTSIISPWTSLQVSAFRSILVSSTHCLDNRSEHH